MLKYILLFAVLLSGFTTQEPQGIKINVVTGHKKITYTAENITDEPLDLFFKVDSEGFRRRADRPVIVKIPARSKKNLVTLIPLKDADTTHTYIAIVTKPENNIAIRKTDTLDREIRRVDPDSIGGR
ncbi:hypothetical protein [Nonlabens marinus]|uniref:Uncharacterized protein n=1 Tax=Nonlabens marinus S1-08 TaxID=1454201 RepID=W8VZ90_9FLAO|nr:hypothetical protein [Nonlabens marinus]BAO54161.1 hypothetical protein NMS_0152 [Nonlabens marinus S1-08]